MSERAESAANALDEDARPHVRDSRTDPIHSKFTTGLVPSFWQVRYGIDERPGEIRHTRPPSAAHTT